MEFLDICSSFLTFLFFAFILQLRRLTSQSLSTRMDTTGMESESSPVASMFCDFNRDRTKRSKLGFMFSSSYWVGHIWFFFSNFYLFFDHNIQSFGISFLVTFERMSTKFLWRIVQIMGVWKNKSQSCVTCGGNTGFIEQARLVWLATIVVWGRQANVYPFRKLVRLSVLKVALLWVSSCLCGWHLSSIWMHLDAKLKVSSTMHL